MGGYFSDEVKEGEVSGLEDRRKECKEFNPGQVYVPVNYQNFPVKMRMTPDQMNTSVLENYGVIPDLVLMEIALYLPPKNLTDFFLSCKLFYSCANSREFWRRYYLNTFQKKKGFDNMLDGNSPSQPLLNWKKHFYMRFRKHTDIYYRRRFFEYECKDSNQQQTAQYDENKIVIAKCVLIGQVDVGKTKFVERIVRDEYYEYLPRTIGASFLTRRFRDIETGVLFKCEIWDTAGQERYKTISPMYFRACDLCFLCFSINDRNSFECEESGFRKYLDTIQSTCFYSSTEIRKYPILILVGMKSDREEERKVSSEEAIEFVKNYRHEKNERMRIHGYVENSSKTGNQCFVSMGLALELLGKRYDLYGDDISDEDMIPQR